MNNLKFVFKSNTLKSPYYKNGYSTRNFKRFYLYVSFIPYSIGDEFEIGFELDNAECTTAYHVVQGFDINEALRLLLQETLRAISDINITIKKLYMSKINNRSILNMKYKIISQYAIPSDKDPEYSTENVDISFMMNKDVFYITCIFMHLTGCSVEIDPQY